MSAGDGSVEIKITGSLDASVAASTKAAETNFDALGTSAKASGDAMAAALKLVGNDLSKITPEMLGLTTATKAFEAETVSAGQSAKAAAVNYQALIDAQLGVGRATKSAEESFSVFNKALDPSPAKRLRDAMTENNHVALNSRTIYEGLSMVHEVMSGRYTRLATSGMIMTQSMVGQEKITQLVTAAMTPLGAAIAGVAVLTVAAAVAAHQYSVEQEKLTASTFGLGAASGLNAQQVQAAASAATEGYEMSGRAALSAAEAFSEAGVKSQTQITQLSESVSTYAALTGEKAADAQKELANAMRDPIKGAQELNDRLGILDGTQMEQIRTLTESGDKFGAVAVIVEAWKHRQEEANEAGVGLTGGLGILENTLSDIWGAFGHAASAANDFTGKIWLAVAAVETLGGLNTTGAVMKGLAGGAPAGKKHLSAQQEADDNTESVKGALLADATPENQAARAKSDLRSNIDQLNKSMKAEAELHGVNSEGYRRDAASLAEYNHALQTYHSEAEKSHQLAGIDAQIATARHAHDVTKLADLTRQRALVGQEGVVETSGAADQKASDAAEKAEAKGAGHAHVKAGPDIVSEWQGQLRAREDASKDYFKDETADELAFWQTKIGQVNVGSKEALAVQGHIHELSKALAHQTYEEQIATLNEQLQADHENWSQQVADWNTKLAFIKSTFTAQSTEYKNAFREFERLQDEHDTAMERKRQEEAKKAVDTLKKQLADQAAIRAGNAKIDETIITAKGENSPGGNIAAAVAVGKIKEQLIQQEIADAATVQAANDARFDDEITKAAGNVDKIRGYDEEKKQSDLQYASAASLQSSKLRDQQLQNILAVQSAYHGYIDGMVSASVSGFSKVIGGQQNLRQVGVAVYQQMVSQIEQQITRMVSNWIVQHLLMTAAQRAQLAAQTAGAVASEGAKTAATVVGSEARVAATATGAAQSSAVVGLHNLKEITSHAAAAAAAAYHAMAGIPIVGPVLGAAAAVATFAAVEAYGALASFAVGTNSVPHDMVAQIHAGERIIPAADNRSLMEAVKPGGKGGKGGDTNLTYAPQLSGDTKPFRQQLADHSSDLFAMLKGAKRDGVFN